MAVATDGSLRTLPLVTGGDFVAAPRVSPAGDRLAWVTWDHPSMPEAVRLDLPDWLLPHLQARFGPALAAEVAGMLGPSSLVLTAQNGIPWWYFFGAGGEREGTRLESVDPGGLVAANLPVGKVIGSVVYPAAEIEAPGIIKHIEGNRFSLGELDGAKSERITAVSEAFAKAGCDLITVHAEATRHLDRSLQVVRGLGKKVGVALNPSTGLEAIEYVMDRIDMVLLMTVNPGFGGQAFIPAVLEKVRRCKKRIGDRPIEIQVDGGVTAETAPRLIDAGVTCMVAGSAVFKGDPAKYAANIAALRA